MHVGIKTNMEGDRKQGRRVNRNEGRPIERQEGRQAGRPDGKKTEKELRGHSMCL